MQMVFEFFVRKFAYSRTKKYNGVSPPHYIKSCIESFRLNWSLPSTHPGMVLINSGGLLNSLYPLYTGNSENAYSKRFGFPWSKY